MLQVVNVFQYIILLEVHSKTYLMWRGAPVTQIHHAAWQQYRDNHLYVFI